MKKFAAIIFLVVFAFNWFGYRLVYNFLQQKSNESLESLFDNNSYDEDQLIELKIAINVPYQSTRNNYERCDGEINVQGTIYKYVKRKVVNDTAYLLCYPNAQKMDLESAKNTFFKLTNDLQESTTGQTSGQFKSVVKNFQPVFNESTFAIMIVSPVSFTKTLQRFYILESLPSRGRCIPGQPPEMGTV